MARIMRDVRWEKAFEDQISRFIPDPRRRDDILRNIEWKLARDPQRFGTRGEEDVWAITTMLGVANLVHVLIYYTFDDKKVILIEVRRRDIP